MQIILLDKVVNLGNLGEVVKVKDGYARNFLIPSGRARRAEFVPQKIAEQQTRLGLATAFAAVEGEVDRVQGIASENRVTHVCLRAC